MDAAIGRRINDTKKESITPEINTAISSVLQELAVRASTYLNWVDPEATTNILDVLHNLSVYMDNINIKNIIEQNSRLITFEKMLNSPELAGHLEQTRKVNSIIQQNGFIEDISQKLDTFIPNAIEFEAMGKQLTDNQKKEDTPNEEKFSTENDDIDDKK